eukprot:1158687-Pelagomonas_calceolata.AAC.3
MMHTEGDLAQGLVRSIHSACTHATYTHAACNRSACTHSAASCALTPYRAANQVPGLSVCSSLACYIACWSSWSSRGKKQQRQKAAAPAYAASSPEQPESPKQADTLQQRTDDN